MALPAEQRIDRLEEALATLSYELASFSRNIHDEMLAFKREMAEFKREMAEFRDESRRESLKFRRELASIAASNGKLVEDIAAPSVPRVLRTLLGLPEDEELDYFAIRLKLRHPERRGEHAEFDCVVAHGQVALIVEVKLRLTPERMTEFAARLPEAREFFPQFARLDVMGAVASVYVDPSLVEHATRLGLLVLAAGDDLLSIYNAPGFAPRRY